MNSGDDVKIYSYKHDGSFHRLWENTVLIAEDDEKIIVGNIRAKVTESDGRFWEAKEPAITIFFKKEWFNVICMIRDTGVHYYSNIASPAFSIDGEIRYVDYDLDVGLSPDGNVRILDEGEYRRHKDEMGYSAEIDFILKQALHDVIGKCKRREFPFVDENVLNLYREFLKVAS